MWSLSLFLSPALVFSVLLTFWSSSVLMWHVNCYNLTWHLTELITQCVWMLDRRGKRGFEMKERWGSYSGQEIGWATGTMTTAWLLCSLVCESRDWENTFDSGHETCARGWRVKIFTSQLINRAMDEDWERWTEKCG